MQRLAATVEAVRSEGWLWSSSGSTPVAASFRNSSAFIRSASRFRKTSARLKRLSDDYDELLESLDGDDADEQTNAKLDALQKQIDELAPPEVWASKAYTTCGAIVRLGHDGEKVVERGLMWSKEARKAKAKQNGRRYSGRCSRDDGLFGKTHRGSDERENCRDPLRTRRPSRPRPRYHRSRPRRPPSLSDRIRSV